jgi:HEAT repeat protein
MRVVLAITLVACLLPARPGMSSVHSSSHGLQGKKRSVSAEPGANWQRIRNRFEVKGLGSVLSSRMWSLIHNYRSKKHLDDLMALLTLFFTAIEKDDPARLASVGGIEGFQARMAGLMKCHDDEVSGFAAIVLGVCGDRSYSRRIAELLYERRRRQGKDAWQYNTTRGAAATALGVLGTKEYAPKMLALLRSANDYDRSGAALGLAYLGDKTHGEAIVRLLRNQKNRDRDAGSAIHAPFLLDVAAEYADDIAKVLQDEFPGDSGETAAYALAKVGAKGHAKDIARLLSSQFQKGYAAKALAVMGATEYVDDILTMLVDESSLSRKDGALALGIMNATQHASEVSKLLKDKEGFVRYYAAVALVLMQAREYAGDVVPIIERFQQDGSHLNESDFNPIVSREFLQIKARFESSLAIIRARK